MHPKPPRGRPVKHTDLDERGRRELAVRRAKEAKARQKAAGMVEVRAMLTPETADRARAMAKRRKLGSLGALFGALVDKADEGSKE